MRPEHAALHGVTLPASDSFWDTYFPPNGWNCRCTVVQVLRDKYPETDHNEAMRLGREAMTRDTKGMFSFNPGKEGRVFPAYNPYTISKCLSCPKAELKLSAGITSNEICEACDEVLRIRYAPEELLKEYQQFSSQKWDHHLLTGNGYVVIDKERPPKEDDHPNEHKKYRKELKMCEDLAEMGHRIQFLNEMNRNDGTYDIRCDNTPADLKKIDGGGASIPRFAKHAFREQSAEIVIF